MASCLALLRELPLFREFPREVLEELERACVCRVFPKGKLIAVPGGEDGKTLLILSGKVKVYRSAGGRRVVLQVLQPGDLFGDLSFLHHPYRLPVENWAQADQETMLCALLPGDVMGLLRRSPAFAVLLLAGLRDRLHQAESKIKDLAISPVQVRLLNELTRHIVSHGRDAGDYWEIEERMTHQSLSEMVGVSRETVTKLLNLLERRGVVSYAPGRLIRLSKRKMFEECPQCLVL